MQKDRTPQGRHKDITGQRYERLVALKHMGLDKHGSALWLFKCDCGTEKEITATRVRSGHTKSCGCLSRESSGSINRTHGASSMKTGKRARIYECWVNMRRRCDYPKNPKYKNYGGRGIKVCDAWNSFEVFRDWATSNGYADNLTLDRIDVNGNYEPANCRWADIKTQAMNTSRTVHIDIGGEILTIDEAAARAGVSRQTIIHRRLRGDTAGELLRPSNARRARRA